VRGVLERSAVGGYAAGRVYGWGKEEEGGERKGFEEGEEGEEGEGVREGRREMKWRLGRSNQLTMDTLRGKR
jgi:hypothetical protein